MSTPESDHITNWRRCDVSQLAKQFHTLENNQFVRLSSTRMSLEKVKKLGSPLDFKIILGLTRDQEETLESTFTTIFEVVRSENSDLIGEKSVGSKRKGAVKVPFEYLETVSRNWLELEAAQIDDSFLTSIPGKSGLSRLLEYNIDKHHNTNLWEFLNDKDVIESVEGEFVFHLGIDFNKRPAEKEYLFAPVLEFKITSSNDGGIISRAARLGFSFGNSSAEFGNDGGESEFYQYMQPCPPFCNGE